VTTAMPPSHEYVEAARELHTVLTDVTHDGPHPRDINQITNNLDIGQALADLRYAACDVADLARDIQHLPDPLSRSGLLFAPASKLTPSVERLHERATGRYVAVLLGDVPEFACTTRSAAIRTHLAVRTLDHALNQQFPLTIAVTVAQRNAIAPEL
jgi:hypothetical protein